MITVILTKDVDGCGRAGDVCDVADGFARNNLLRRGYAVVATPSQIARHKAEAKKREEIAAQQKEQAKRVTQLLDGKTITIAAKHDHETLFAAIDAAVIARELSALIGETVSSDVVVLETPIKKIGDHDVTLRFAQDATAHVRVTVTGV